MTSIDRSHLKARAKEAGGIFLTFDEFADMQKKQTTLETRLETITREREELKQLIDSMNRAQSVHEAPLGLRANEERTIQRYSCSSSSSSSSGSTSRSSSSGM